MVFLFHAFIVARPGLNNTKYNEIFLDFSSYSIPEIILSFSPVAYGHSGVQLFLILSGFLIHFNYLNRGKRLNYFVFMNRRFWRIYPTYALFLVVFAYFFYRGKVDFLLHASLLHNLSDKYLYSINPSFWSLALEFQLYAIYPLYLFLNRTFGALKTLWIIGIMAGIFIGVGIYVDIESQAYNKFLFKNWITWVLGAYVAECYHKNMKFYNGNWWSVLFISVAIIISKAFSIYWELNVYLFSILYAIILDKFLREEINLYPFANRIFNFISFVGVISYSLYLIHQPFLSELMNLFSFGTGNAFLSFTLTFAFLTAVSYGVYLIVEKPSIATGRKIERWINKRDS